MRFENDLFEEWPLKGTVIEQEGDMEDTSLLYDFDPWLALRQIEAWKERWHSIIEEWRENSLRLEAIARGENPCSACPHREDGSCPRAGCIFAQIWEWRRHYVMSLEVVK